MNIISLKWDINKLRALLPKVTKSLINKVTIKDESEKKYSEEQKGFKRVTILKGFLQTQKFSKH